MVAAWHPQSPPPGVILFYELQETSRVPWVLLYRGNDTKCELPAWATVVALRVATGAGLGDFSVPTIVSGRSSSPESSSSGDLPTVAIIVGAACFLAALLLVMWYKRGREVAAATAALESSASHRLPPNLRGDAREIDASCLLLLEQLGEGKFGKVFKALLDEKDDTGVPAFIVAAKVSMDNASEKQNEETLKEAATMAKLSHDNIVNIIGICRLSEHRLVVVVQYCEHGSLLAFFAARPPAEVAARTMTFAWQVSRGMKYLSWRGFIHRDLAVCPSPPDSPC
jgi:hypothetical protein